MTSLRSFEGRLAKIELAVAAEAAAQQLGRRASLFKCDCGSKLGTLRSENDQRHLTSAQGVQTRSFPGVDAIELYCRACGHWTRFTWPAATT